MMRYSPIPFIADCEALPTNLPNPNVTLPLDQLESFRKSYEEMGTWISRQCGVEWKTLCTLDLLSFEAKQAAMRRLAEEMLRLLKDTKDYLGSIEEGLPPGAPLPERFEVIARAELLLGTKEGSKDGKEE